MSLPTEDGLSVVHETDPAEPADDAPVGVDGDGSNSPRDTELESLRDEFVAAFNSRDLEAILALVRADVECPDIGGDGTEVLSEELEAIWERSPGALLTRGFVDGTSCAVAWLPDEDGGWSRAALVSFDSDDGLLSVVSLPDDTDSLERAEAEDPTGEELEEWQDWAEWEHGEETVPRHRGRARP